MGRRASPSTLASTVTPMTAPTMPGRARRSTRPRSTLPKRQCERADARPVTTLARLTVVDAAAGDSPAPSRMLEAVGPNPMPRAPSTRQARNPARPTRMS